jgi:hypothetical protein
VFRSPANGRIAIPRCSSEIDDFRAFRRFDVSTPSDNPRRFCVDTSPLRGRADHIVGTAVARYGREARRFAVFAPAPCP